MSFVPIVRTTLVQSVMDQVLNLIKDGSLNPGDRLPPERELMKSLGVGRSTVREALHGLSMFNLIEMRHGQGTFVKEIQINTVVRPDLLSSLLDRSITTDLLETRRLIEPAVAELAANRASEAEINQLNAILDQCRVLHEKGESTAAISAQLHLAIAQCTHNSVILMFMESILGLLTERGSRLEQVQGYYEWEIESHQKIIDVLKTHKSRLAHQLMRQHLDESAARLFSTQV